MFESRRRNMQYELTVRTMPVLTNALYHYYNGARILTKKARENKEAIAWEARLQFRHAPLTGPIRAEIALWWPDRRKHDIDAVKGLLDALSGIIWADDDQIVDLHLTKGYDKANPRVELAVEECG